MRILQQFPEIDTWLLKNEQYKDGCGGGVCKTMSGWAFVLQRCERLVFVYLFQSTAGKLVPSRPLGVIYWYSADESVWLRDTYMEKKKRDWTRLRNAAALGRVFMTWGLHASKAAFKTLTQSSILFWSYCQRNLITDCQPVGYPLNYRWTVLCHWHKQHRKRLGAWEITGNWDGF